MKRAMRKQFFAACAGSLAFISASQSAQAGPFLDWLIGPRQPAPVAVGAPQYVGAIPGYSAQGGLVQGGLIPGSVSTTPVVSGYLPSNVPVQTGLPVTSVPMTNSVPTTTAVAPSYGTYGSSSSYYVPQGALGPTAVTGIPQTQVAHLPNVGYASQWNRAPVTLYRPVTSLDPATGTTVTRMMPCTSYELQSQRVPVLSMRPAWGSYYSQTSRWPSVTAPSYGPTPVPSSVPMSRIPNYSTNYVPNYGAPMVSSPSLSGNYALTPVYGQQVYGPQAYGPAYVPSYSAQGVAPASASLPIQGNYPPATAWPSNPVLGSYPATSPVYPSGQVGPVTNGVYNGVVESTPSASGVYPSSGTVPSDSGWVTVPGSVAPNGSFNSTPGSYQVTPGTESSSGVADPDSVMPPSLDRNRDQGAINRSKVSEGLARGNDERNSENRFPLRNLARSNTNSGREIDTAAKNPFPRDEEPAATPSTPSVSVKVESPSMNPSNSMAPSNLNSGNRANDLMEAPKPAKPFNFDGVRPIPGPADMEAPRFNPSLLNARDQTAQAPSSAPSRGLPNRVEPAREPTSQGNVRWISAEIDRPSSKGSVQNIDSKAPLRSLDVPNTQSTRPSSIKQPSKASSNSNSNVKFGTRSSSDR